MIGYETAQVNSQLVNVAPGQAFNPLVFGNAYTGPGRWPRNGVYNVPPVVPSGASPASQNYNANAPSTGGATHPFPTAGAMRSDGSAGFYGMKRSPLIWALLFLAGGLWMLHNIHYK